eukprot:5239835-Amphidinium_carterae.2
MVESNSTYLRWGEGDSSANLEWVLVYVFTESMRADGPRCFWQLRELVLVLVSSLKCKSWQYWWCKFAKSQEFGALVERLGAVDSDLLPSALAARRSNLPAGIRELCKQEMCCSTLVLLLFLSDWGHRLRGEVRKMAHRITADLFRKLLQSTMSTGVALEFLLGDYSWAGTCDSKVRGERSCKHCLLLLSDPKYTSTIPFQHVSELLCTCYGQKYVCADVMLLWQYMLHRLAASMDTALLEPVVHFASSCQNLHQPRGKKRRLRVDKEALFRDAGQAKRHKFFKTARQAARAGAFDVDKRQMDEAELLGLKMYHAGCFKVCLGHVGDFSLVHLFRRNSNISTRGGKFPSASGSRRGVRLTASNLSGFRELLENR